MLFSSYEFLFLFLPVTLAGYLLLDRSGHRRAIAWLVVASLFFYGWWDPSYLLLILASMALNYVIGARLADRPSRPLLALGISANLAALAWFKYAGFAVATANAMTGAGWSVPDIVLPLAISFFTFQQIAYLVDAHQQKAVERDILRYALFVTFFPQLIAGPIVHHSEMLPQFRADARRPPWLDNIAVGLTILAIGLFKKTVLADGIAQYASPVFADAAAGNPQTLLVAWGGALAYTFQLYFDFSGYSDMAIGAARLFGIRLPLNFHSPYKATSISEFWRRWHMTLSRFLRDYLYIPLGGNRKGPTRRQVNLIATMLIGGLWHGAGWTFVVWGGLHGAYLAINHVWRGTRLRAALVPVTPRPVRRAAAWGLTFIAVVVSWVFFRATSFDAAFLILEGMAGFNGVAIPNAIAARLGDVWTAAEAVGMTTYLGGGQTFVLTWAWIGALLAAATLAPNTQQIMAEHNPGFVTYNSTPESHIDPLPRLSALRWRPNLRWALVMAATAVLGVLAIARVSEFLYFQF